MARRPAQGTPDYDAAVATDGLWLLRDAHDHWLAEYDEVSKTRGDTEHHRTVALRLHQHTASVLTWARAMDDLCDGDPNPLPSYRAARPPRAALLDGARYASNRSLHQLLTLTRSIGGFRFPLVMPLIANEVGIIRWADGWHLPPLASEFPAQQVLRGKYMAAFAGRPIFATLAELREWFEQQVA